MSAEETTHRVGSDSGNPPWRAKTLWIAAGLALLGLVLWVTTPPETASAPAASEQTSLTQSSEGSTTPTVRSLQGSPALFRFGVSYIAGFFLGYGLRRFLKTTLLVTALVAGVLFTLQYAGWIDLDWAGIQSHLSQSLGWLKGQAEAFRQFVTGYVPSATAAAVGLFFGARWR